jgi:hypothetical protein
MAMSAELLYMNISEVSLEGYLVMNELYASAVSFDSNMSAHNNVT